MKRYNHLTIEDRLAIESGINSNKTCREISLFINRNESTVRREVYNNRYKVLPNMFNNPFAALCPCSQQFPYVCNNCPNGKRSKRNYRYFYSASIAQESYEKRTSTSRSKPQFDKEQLEYIDSKFKEGLKNNQPLNHIIHAHNLPISVSTGYRWIRTNIISTKTIDLQKAVTYKIIRPDNMKRSAERQNRIGRSYDMYLDYISKHPEVNMVEMDVVEGIRSDKKCILTFVCIKSNLLFSVLLDFHNKESVVDALNKLERKLGIEVFKRFFGVILTDNGSEFNDVLAMEFSPYTGERRTRVYYCDPRRSDQKGTIERKHVDMRLIIPKKRSFDFLTQKKVDLMNSNINGILRPTLNNQSTYAFSLFLHSKKTIKALGIFPVESKLVNLSPELLN